jgi:FkbM family methyltransferase
MKLVQRTMTVLDWLAVKVKRRLAFRALKSLRLAQRGEVLEGFVENMIMHVPVGEATIALYSPFPGLTFRADSFLTKEADTIKWIDSFKDDQVFWDIGANVGVYSLYAAVTRRSRVSAFEPSSANYYVLTRNCQLNDLTQRLEAYCLAFASATELGVINLASYSMGAATHQFGKLGDVSPYTAKSKLAHSMLGFTIDDFIKQFQPAFPNHIKIDVDGRELDIICGAKQTLKDARLESILVELSLRDIKETEQAKSLLAEAGFSVVSRGEAQGIEPNFGANHIFRRAGAVEGRGKAPR